MMAKAINPYIPATGTVAAREGHPPHQKPRTKPAATPCQAPAGSAHPLYWLADWLGKASIIMPWPGPGTQKEPYPHPYLREAVPGPSRQRTPNVLTGWVRHQSSCPGLALEHRKNPNEPHPYLREAVLSDEAGGVAALVAAGHALEVQGDCGHRQLHQPLVGRLCKAH